MHHRGTVRHSAILPVLLLTVMSSQPGVAQQRPLSTADFGQWERLGDFELDPTGTWLVASISRVDESRELQLYRSSGVGEALVLEDGFEPSFSSDGRWLAYRKAPPQGADEESEDPVPDRLGLVDLEAVRDTVLFEIEAVSFRADGAWLAAQRVASADSLGADLMVWNPATGSRTTIGNVDEFAWQDDGELLAATLLTAGGAGNSVVLFDPASSTLRTLDAREARYRALTWREASRQLAVMRSVESDDHEDESHDLLVWEDVSAGAKTTLAGVGRSDLPVDYRVTEFAGIDFSSDGQSVFFGLRPWDLADTDSGSDSESGDGDLDQESDEVAPADVQVWHWDDDQILRAQESRAGQISRQTFLAVWHLRDDRLVMLGDDLVEAVEVTAGGRWGIVPDFDPYRFDRRFGAGTADWYRVDVRTGERDLIARGLEFGVVSRFDAERALVYGEDHWSSVDLESLARTPLADGKSFTRSVFDHDYPGSHPSWGIGGWIEGAPQVLLYDKHDVWLADLDGGSAVRLTHGAESGRQYRVVNLDPEASFFDDALLDSEQAVWMSVHDLSTKASGYARVGLRGGAEILVEDGARLSGLTRARDAERFAFRSERWDDSPDVFVGDGDLDMLEQVTATNPFQSDYAWGRSELLEYTTDAGHDLQAILVYPAGFEAGTQYPLILYQYERLSDNLHSYDVPSERDYYNYQTWSQRGYFVLMPDIVYEPGRPGPSALDAVEHALDAAVATGHVDRDAMGLIGHSWGGYQASYLPTRTDRFAASVAGAAITNFLSFMGAVHWNGGLPETGHWETGQARMAAPYWERLDAHLESSPANFIQDLDTPMLLMHGDQDGVVDFYQGMEFYNYARRAGKEVVLLVYPGADHGLAQETQQVDYHRRILEWFDHYLKGEPAASWISDGETWVERGKRIGG